MKILHISTTNSGGAGKAAMRLHFGLRSTGIDSKMLVINKVSSNSDVIQFRQKFSFIERICNKIKDAIITSEYNYYKTRRPEGFDLFSDIRSIYSISKHPLVREADIINLHWIIAYEVCRERFKDQVNILYI